MVQVPFVALDRQAAEVRDEIDAAIAAIVDSCRFVGGPLVEKFEKAFAAYCGAEHCVGVSSGTSALHLALVALGIGPGDQVIVPANTFIATAEAVSQVGADVVLVDVDEDTYNMKPELFEHAVTRNTRAVIPVHLYGQCADMDAINIIADKHGIIVIEDAAQAHGASYRGKNAGSLARAAGFSFHPASNLGAFGDGGAIVTSDVELARKARQLSDHGRMDKGRHAVPAFNARLDSLQAAVLSIKLKKLNQWVAARRRCAALYGHLIFDVPVTLPHVAHYGTHAYHLYVVQIPNGRRDDVRKALADSGVASDVHYPVPLHLQPAYKHLGCPEGQFPVSERLSKSILSLPLFETMTENEITRVAQALRKTV